MAIERGSWSKLTFSEQKHCTVTQQNTVLNEPEWHRNILKWAEMRLEWTRIWSAEPEKGKMWCFSFPFFFFFFLWGQERLKTCILIRVAVCEMFFPRLVGFFLCEWCNNCPSLVPHLMFPLLSFTGLSDAPKKVAEVSVIWVLVVMFPLKIVHRTKQREETVWTSRTCFLLNIDLKGCCTSHCSDCPEVCTR